MSATATLGQRIKQARDLINYTQADLAEALGVNRVIIAYWETDARVPGLGQLNELAAILGVRPAILLGQEPFPTVIEDDQALLYRGLTERSPRTRRSIAQWLAFLDRWADLLERVGTPAAPRKPAWSFPEAMTDLRRVSTFAGDARRLFELGEDPISNLDSILDQHGFLVYRTNLDAEEAAGISGAYYQHPRLGPSILINTNTTPGRQTFTLAHELAHALFHYQTKAIISRAGDTDPKERFANAFAADFLVPKTVIDDLIAIAPVADPRDVFDIARYFHVSYTFMLIRLHALGHITIQQRDEYRNIRPTSLARNDEISDYLHPEDLEPISLATYPASVLRRLRHLIAHGNVSIPAAASLLGLAQEEIVEELLITAEPAEPADLREFEEFLALTAKGAIRQAVAEA